MATRQDRQCFLDFCKEQGIPTVRVFEGTKVPVEDFKKADTKEENYSTEYFKDYNVGVLAGGKLKNGSRLIVLDIDHRNFSDGSKEFLKDIEEAADTLKVLSASKDSSHRYYQYDGEEDFTSDFDIVKGISVMCGSRMNVAPTSYNKEKDSYYQIAEDSVDYLEVLPQIIVEKYKSIKRPKPVVRSSSVSKRDTSTEETYDLIEGLKKYAKKIEKMPYHIWATVIASSLATCARDLEDRDGILKAFIEISKLDVGFKSEEECIKKFDNFYNKVHKEEIATGENSLRKLLKENGIDYEQDHHKWMDGLASAELERELYIRNQLNIFNFEAKDNVNKCHITGKRINPESLFKLPTETAPKFSLFVEKIYNRAPYKMGKVSLATALTLIANATGSVFETPSKCPTSLFFIFALESGGGKQSYIKLVKENSIGSKEIPASGRAMIELTKTRKRNNLLIISEEFGSHLTGLFDNKKSNPQADETRDFYLTAYDQGQFSESSIVAEVRELRKKEKEEPFEQQEEEEILHNDYSVCQIASTQPLYIKTIMQNKEAYDSGYLNRQIIFSDIGYEHDSFKLSHFTRSGEKFKDDLLEELQLDCKKMKEEKRNSKKAKTTVCLENEVEKLIDEVIVTDMKVISKDEEVKSGGSKENLMKRMIMNTLRLASNIAIYEGAKEKRYYVTEEVILFSYSFVRWSTLELFKVIDMVEAEEELKKASSISKKACYDIFHGHVDKWVAGSPKEGILLSIIKNKLKRTKHGKANPSFVESFLTDLKSSTSYKLEEKRVKLAQID